RFPARAGSRYLDLEGAHPVLLSLLGSVLGGDLRRIRRRLSRSLEAHGAGRRPGDGVSLCVSDGDHRVVKGRVHVRDSRSDVLTFASADAGGFFAHSQSSKGAALPRCNEPPNLPATARPAAGLLLLPGYRLGRTLTRAGIGMGALSANREPAAMPQPPVATQIHQPLDVHGHVAAQISFHKEIAVDDLANLQHFLVGQLRYPALFGDPD